MAEPITPDQAMAVMGFYTVAVAAVGYGLGEWRSNLRAAKRDAARRHQVESDALDALRAIAENTARGSDG